MLCNERPQVIVRLYIHVESRIQQTVASKKTLTQIGGPPVFLFCYACSCASYFLHIFFSIWFLDESGGLHSDSEQNTEDNQARRQKQSKVLTYVFKWCEKLPLERDLLFFKFLDCIRVEFVWLTAQNILHLSDKGLFQPSIPLSQCPLIGCSCKQQVWKWRGGA